MMYLHCGRWAWWKYCWTCGDSRIGIFRNLPHVKPGRWGFFVLGFEVGSRDPGSPIGVWLKTHGLWPW